MAFDLSSITKNTGHRPPLILIHGTPGIGKTTFAAQFPKPLFIMVDEGGLGSNEVDAFPTAKKMEDVFFAIKACLELKPGQKDTLVIDSLSSLEMLIFNHVSESNGLKRIDAINYGKGYDLALEYWHKICQACRKLLEDGIFKYVVLIAHTSITEFKNPEGESYHRYNTKLHRKTADLFCEQSDIVGFASQPIYIKKVDSKGKDRAVAGKKGEPLLYLRETPSLVAKNRYALPDSIEFNASVFLQALKGDK